MIATCTHCESKFRVDDSKLGPRGARVKCSKCGTSFIVRPEVAVEEVRIGETRPPPLMPPEPTPASLTPFPVEVTPPPSIPAATALAPPLPGPPEGRAASEPATEAPTEDSRFDLPPPRPPSHMASEPTPPPMPRVIPKAPPPPPPEPIDHSIGTAMDEGVMELDSADDFETTTPGLQTGPEPLELDASTPPPPAASDSLLDLAGPGFAPGRRPETEQTKLMIDASQFRIAPPSAQDLFDASFASPLAPAPTTDEPTLPMHLPAPDPDDSALADMPRFEEEPDAPAPEFSGGMSQDGIVTKNVDVSALRAQMQSQPVASIALDRPELRDGIAENLVEPPPRAAGRSGGPLLILTSGLVLIVALALVAIYFAGGWQGLTQSQPAQQSVSVEALRVIPYATRDGSRFWIVRGRVKNRSKQEQAMRVEVTGGGSSASTDLGLSLDPLALYTRGDVTFVGTPEPSLAPGASAEFSVALSAGAVPDADALRAQPVPR